MSERATMIELSSADLRLLRSSNELQAVYEAAEKVQGERRISYEVRRYNKAVRRGDVPEFLREFARTRFLKAGYREGTNGIYSRD